MEWMSVSSVEELKKLGKFREVSNSIKNDVKDTGIKISGRGWNDLWKSIEQFKDSISKFCPKQQPKAKKIEIVKQTNEETIYFNSQASEYIFYLIELDGEIRMKKLGITNAHFKNKRLAKKWREDISKAIHPDVCQHPYATQAMSKLNDLYSQMES